MPSTLQERLAKALSNVRNPRTGADVYSTQQVRDIGGTPDGRVHLTLLLTKDDDPALAKHVRDAVTAVDGVIDVQLKVTPVKLPDAPPAPAKSRMLPVMDQAPAAPARPSAPTPKHYPGLG
ncbi:MAG: iron-sulfur cluster assembly protein, partial [bacterium]